MGDARMVSDRVKYTTAVSESWKEQILPNNIFTVIAAIGLTDHLSRVALQSEKDHDNFRA